MLPLPTLLRYAALALGYTLPMLVLLAPYSVSLYDARVVAIFLGSPCLVILAQWRVTRPARAAESGASCVTLGEPELRAATGGFAASHELGRGGFGTVYSTSARLPSLVLRQGRCAVKRLSSGSVQGLDELLNEIRLLGKCRHENLLPLLGFCLEPRAPCLVYPLMLGGNLDDRLHRSAGERA